MILNKNPEVSTGQFNVAWNVNRIPTGTSVEVTYFEGSFTCGFK